MFLLPLVTLTLAAFAIGTTEFSIQGLLPEVAADMHVGIPDAGLLVTGYALGVSIGGPIIAILTNSLRRKTTLLLLMGIFIAGHAFCATAQSYTMLMIARVVASLCHGAFMGVGSVVAVRIVPEDRRASAVALMWGGIAAANIFGVPAGTALGHAFGWRSTFWAITALGVVAAAAIAIWLPEAGRGPRTGLVGEVRPLLRLQVLLSLALGLFACAATFSVFTFIAPALFEVTGIHATSLPYYLLVFGVGGVIGMQVGGRFGDRAVMASIIGSFSATIAVYLTLLVALRSPAPALIMMFVWGFAFYFVAGPLQVRVVDAAREAPNLVSTVMQSSFNLGIAIGPIAGATVLSDGMSYALLPICGAALATVGFLLALWSAALDRRQTVAVGAQSGVGTPRSNGAMS
jgi:MFS transporter, DHA1 family, inner membrane transport protein